MEAGGGGGEEYKKPIVAQTLDCHQAGNNKQEDYNLGVSMSTINQNSLWILMVFSSSSDDRDHRSLHSSLVILVLQSDLWLASSDKMQQKYISVYEAVLCKS